MGRKLRVKYKKPSMLSIKTFIFNPVQENTYVLYNDQKQCCIIDPGCYFSQERNELKEFINATGLLPVLLLNTHCHLDHVFGNKFVHDTWGLTLHFHEKEKPVFDNAPAAGIRWQLPFENYKGDLIFLKEGEKISIGKDEMDVLFTPGHSPGSVSFYDKKEGFVISGDVLFKGSIGRTDLPGASFETLANSIHTQLFVLPEETKVFSGHGAPTTIGFEKKNNPYLQ
jgi:hydroxyacylglutathione hydrolase